MDPVVVGIDSSTQSTKAIAFDRQGRSVAEGRGQVPLSNPTLYWFEQEPEHWWSSTAEALGQLTDKVDAGAIEAISISNQRETIGFLNANGEPTRPAMVWLDERARAEVETADEAFGAERIHQITGRPVDLTPCLYRLRWLAKHEPQIFEQTQKFVDVNAYLTKRLTGRLACGWFACDPMGYFDLAEKNWSAPLLEWLEIDETRLPEFEAPGDLLGEVTEEAASATGLKPGTPVFAGGGDGQCAALGTNCTASDQAYLNLGTAVVGGIWSAAYKNDRAWRTELSADGEGYILEICLRSGAFLINWFVDQFVGDRLSGNVFSKLEEDAQKIPIGSDGLLSLPYWSGVMNPHWDTSARGAFLGLGGGHTPAHLFRSLLEGMTLEQARGFAQMERQGQVEIRRILAIGGGAASGLWPQMLADACAKPVVILDTVEASALGAAMIAAKGAGWYPSIREAAAAMQGRVVREHEPDPDCQRVWAELAQLYDRIYGQNAETFKALVAFAARHRSER